MLENVKKVKLITTVGFIICLGLLIWFLFSGGNFELLLSLFDSHLTSEQLRDKLMDFGFRGYITIGVFSMLQVILSFLPAEPTQVLAGLAFGFPIGFLCCAVGVFVGNTIIYLLYKTYGNKIRDYFIKNLNFDTEKAALSGRIVMVVFILYFLPAIPYGMICFFAASVGMKYRRFITVTFLGSIPSICIGVGLGHMTLSASWIISLCVFLVLVVLIMILSFKKEWIFRKVNEFAQRPKYSSKTTVRKCNKLLFNVIYFFLPVYYRLCGIKISLKSNCGKKIPAPAIVLCNHGSFIDFIYAAKLLKKNYPNFVVARLYFYHKLLGSLLKKLGCFPKSMFATDIESTKNCIKVLKDGGVLAMMPEARLSTAGRFEDIQESTFSFLKKSAVPVYTVKLCGDYFADPKWGKGMRKGALVEAELDILFTAEEINALSVSEIKKGVEEKLYYDEFKWLEARPNIRYKNKNLAEGLENILSICPKCRQRHTITTKGREIFCETCGKLTELDDRYAFTPDFLFKNFGEWYDWQKCVFEAEISKDENYSLVAEVELRLPDEKGKKLTRKAGNGVCTLNRLGFKFEGVKDNEPYVAEFSIDRAYRLLFGAGENFEIYNGSEILYFVPLEKRSCIDWYLTSMILYDRKNKELV